MWQVCIVHKLYFTQISSPILHPHSCNDFIFQESQQEQEWQASAKEDQGQNNQQQVQKQVQENQVEGINIVYGNIVNGNIVFCQESGELKVGN